MQDDVIEIVLLYRRQDGCVYCVTELVDLLALRQLGDDGARLGLREQRALSDEQVMQQVDLMLRLVLVGDAESAQRPEPGIDAVDRARLGGERFDQFAAAPDERPRGVGESAGIAQGGDAPGIQYC